MSDITRPNVLSWFDIPVVDLARAIRFYEAILGVELQRYDAPGIEGALFPARGVSGTLLKGQGFSPSHQGSVVYLDGGADLNTILKRVEPAGGKQLLPKTEIPGGRGFFAYFQDSEGNRIGLNSRA